MVKRKRASASPLPNSDTATEPTDATYKNQKRLCTRCLTSTKKNLTTALRLGAGFERQKHSRRKKTAQAKKDNTALERLEAEYVVLKGLELEKVADQHLSKTVGKIKSLKDQHALKECVAGIQKGSTDAATLNVLARLYKVAAVKKVVDDAIEELKGICGTEDVAQTKNGEKEELSKQKRSGIEDTELLSMGDDDDDAFAAFDVRIAAPSSGDDDSEGSISDDERPSSVGDSESEHDPEDDLAAESESADDVAFEGSGEDDEKDSSDDDVTINRRIAPPSDVSDSDSDASDSDEASVHAKIAKLKAPVFSSSAFIPTLSQAAYIAGSESEASDLDAEFAPRKNRRGQRARQKIAEAKFGAKAKHLEKEERNQGWDPKRGAVGDNRSRRGTNTGFGPQQSGQNAIPLGKKKGEEKKRDDRGELHPSWQAAKMAKEKKQIKIDIKAPQGAGKKIMF
ncbi:Bud-site selection protein, partial [Ophiobolus disseminans]